MELGSVMAQAFSSAFAPVTMLYALLGVILGVTVGAIPGLTGDMAIAILLPFVYKVDPSMSLGPADRYLQGQHVRRLHFRHFLRRARHSRRRRHR